jgi:Cu+-exporting ATPase
MIRRQFIKLAAMAGVTSVAAAESAVKSSEKVVSYRVAGFSCITCAVGLDVMLEREKGVVWAKSDYKEAKSVICFHPDMITEEYLQAAIADMGFKATKQS